jgi:spore coat protein CotH
MKSHRFIASFVLCCASLASAYEYSGVVVSKTTGSPVEGVLVSVGHSEFYTRTDQNGRFELANPNTTTPTRNKAEPQKMQWYFRGTTLDLRSYQGVNSVSIYTVNGKKIFNSQVPPSGIIGLPSSLPIGIYLLELGGEKGVISRGSTKLAKDLADSERLIFMHDDYLPKDSAMTGSGADMRIELKSDERAFVFDQSKVREYRFTLSATDLNYLNTRGYREEFLQADLSFDGNSLGTVGLRYKGSSYTLPRCFFPSPWGGGDVDTTGTPNKTCAKISYKIKFTQYDPDKRFHGLKKLNLHALSADGTKIHEIISYELFREMGIHAPRVSYANVYVNNTLIGLFAVVEEIDGRFTKSRWPAYGDGNLYKEVWPKSADAQYYLSGLKTNDKPEDNASMQRMISYYNAINSSNEQTFEQNLSTHMDFDYFLRYLAVDVAIKNWDGFRSWYVDQATRQGRNHNYFFYEEENSGGKIWIVPWDMDQALGERDNYFDGGGGGFGGGQPLPQWNVPTTNCGSQSAGGNNFIPPNCDKLFKLTAAVFWSRYVELGDLFLRDVFVSQRLTDKINKHTQTITNAVQQDPNINQSTWTTSVNSMKNYLPNHIAAFRNYLHP